MQIRPCNSFSCWYLHDLKILQLFTDKVDSHLKDEKFSNSKKIEGEKCATGFRWESYGNLKKFSSSLIFLFSMGLNCPWLSHQTPDFWNVAYEAWHLQTGWDVNFNDQKQRYSYLTFLIIFVKWPWLKVPRSHNIFYQV